MSTLAIGREETATYYTMGRKKATAGHSGNNSTTSSTATASMLSIIVKPKLQSQAKAIKQPKNDSLSHEQVIPTEEATNPRPQLTLHEFEKIFNSAYHDFFHFNKISTDSERAISSQEVDIEEFDRLTLRKQYQRYISLFEGRIIFHEVPNSPHSEVISYLHDTIA